MNKTNEESPHFAHLDAATFRNAVERTAQEFRFRPVLVEKDYFCSLVLQPLVGVGSPLVFKGGTCLSKVYADFYRLSEDLDFGISMNESASRSARRRLIQPVRELIDAVLNHVPGIQVVESLTGRNESRQYVASIVYRSTVTGDNEKIKIEVGLREPLLRPPILRPARTLLRSAFTGREVVQPFPARSIDFAEAMAEKVRAALTRRGPAIRDFFDIQFAIQHLDLHLSELAFVNLVKKKIAAPGNDPVQLTPERRAILERQKATELSVVLRTDDVKSFDLDQVWSVLTVLAKELQ